jgi:hypothetical protein
VEEFNALVSRIFPDRGDRDKAAGGAMPPR